MKKPNQADYSSIKEYQEAYKEYNKNHNENFISKMKKPSQESIKKNNDLRKTKPKKQKGFLGSIIQEKKKLFKIN